MQRSDENPKIDFSEAPAIIRKPAQFFQKYWYYYKMPVLIIGVFAVVAILTLVSALTNRGVDYTFCVASDLVIADDQNRLICENVKPYLKDIDGNKKLDIAATVLFIDPDQDQDEYAASQSDQLTLLMVNKEVTFFIADEYAMEYLTKMGMIEPFSVLGVGDNTEYSIPVSGDDLLKDTVLEEFDDYYLCVKAASAMYANDKDYNARRAGTAELISALKNK